MPEQTPENATDEDGRDLSRVPEHLRKYAFPPGAPGGPGRPRGGRAAMVVEVVFGLVGRGDNRAKLDKALQAYFDKNPVRYLRELMLPLVPRNLEIDAATQQTMLKIVTNVDVDAI